jgi:hypothetical protein
LIVTLPRGFSGSASSLHSESALPGASACSKDFPVVAARWLDKNAELLVTNNLL